MNRPFASMARLQIGKSARVAGLEAGHTSESIGSAFRSSLYAALGNLRALLSRW